MMPSRVDLKKIGSDALVALGKEVESTSVDERVMEEREKKKLGG